MAGRWLDAEISLRYTKLEIFYQASNVNYYNVLGKGRTTRPDSLLRAPGIDVYYKLC